MRFKHHEMWFNHLYNQVIVPDIGFIHQETILKVEPSKVLNHQTCEFNHQKLCSNHLPQLNVFFFFLRAN